MTTDEEIQASVKEWISQKVASGQTAAKAFGDIIKNAKDNIKTVGEQIAAKREALKGVSKKEIEKTLEQFYTVSRREERILVNATTVKKSGWKPNASTKA